MSIDHRPRAGAKGAILCERGHAAKNAGWCQECELERMIAKQDQDEQATIDRDRHFRAMRLAKRRRR